MLLARTSARSRASAGLLSALSRQATPTRLSLGRCVAGSVMALRPSLVPTSLGVDPVSAGRTAWAVQMLGARDLALGVGTLVALRRGDTRGARVWLLAGLFSDAVDAVAVSAAIGRGTVRPAPGAVTVATAVTAVAVGASALGGDELR